MESRSNPNRSLRRHALRATAVLALAIPTAAFAAAPVEETFPPAEPTALLEFGRGDAAKIANRFEDRIDELDGPFHPVALPSVDYGSVEAAFGDARGRPHEGQDIFAPSGTPVISPTPTKVLETGGGDDRGNWAAIYDREADRTYVYFHMLRPADVRAGQKLAAGERVGLVGCTGSCYGEHLHFEVRAGADPYGAPQDPLPLLERWQPAA